jgi:protein O-mannosyl-transferase
MVLPVILILLDWWPLRRIRFKAELAPSAGSAQASNGGGGNRISARWLPIVDKIPIAIASIGVLVLTLVEQRRSGDTSMLPNLSAAVRLSNAVIGYVRYLGLMVWPARLSCFYPYPKSVSMITVVLCALLLTTATAVSLYQSRRRPWLLMGWLWFVLTLVPNSGLVQAGAQSIADRYTQIPMMGLVIALMWSVSEGLTRWPKWQRPVVWGGTVALVVLSLLTVRQIGYWHDGEKLFGHAVEVEDSSTMRYNLGLFLEKAGRDGEAEAQYKASIEINPNALEPHNNYAMVLIRMQQFDEALAEARAAVKVDPNSPKATKTLAYALLSKGDLRAALDSYSRAASLGSNPVRIAAFLNDYAASLAAKKQFEDAELLVRKAVELDPALPEARRNLVLILLSQHRNGEARAAFDQAIAQTGKRSIYADLAPRVAQN